MLNLVNVNNSRAILRINKTITAYFVSRNGFQGRALMEFWLETVVF